MKEPFLHLQAHSSSSTRVISYRQDEQFPKYQNNDELSFPFQRNCEIRLVLWSGRVKHMNYLRWWWCSLIKDSKLGGGINTLRCKIAGSSYSLCFLPFLGVLVNDIYCGKELPIFLRIHLFSGVTFSKHIPKWRSLINFQNKTGVWFRVSSEWKDSISD